MDKQTCKLELLSDWPLIIDQFTQRFLQTNNKDSLNLFKQVWLIKRNTEDAEEGVGIFSLRNPNKSNFAEVFLFPDSGVNDGTIRVKKKKRKKKQQETWYKRL